MENKLDKARKIINEVDSKMVELFVERMRAAEMVYEHKKEFGLPILDQARENADETYSSRYFRPHLKSTLYKTNAPALPDCS